MFDFLKHSYRRNKWLYLCLTVWLVKGFLLATISQGWMGEDELAHFDYANTLRRTGAWQVFEENLTTEEAWQAYTVLNDHDAYPQDRVSIIASDAVRVLRDDVSDHRVSTGYQPPLYYWILAKILSFPGMHRLDVLSWLYVLRMVSVLCGGLTIVIMWKFFELIGSSEKTKILAIGFTIWHPLFSFLHSMVNVDVFVILEFSVWFYLLCWGIVKGWNFKQVVLLILILFAGLMTKQSMLIPTLLTGIALIYSLLRKTMPSKLFILAAALLLVAVWIVYSDYSWRSSQTVFLHNNELREPHTVIEYFFTQLRKIRGRDFVSFWEMTLAFVPYYAADLFSRVGRILIIFAVLGLSYRVFEKWKMRNSLMKREVWLVGVLAAISVVVWWGFLMTWDVMKFVSNSEAWFKGRYLFVMWIPLVFLLTKGWMIIAAKFRLERVFVMGILSFTALYQISAWAALLITMNL